MLNRHCVWLWCKNVIKKSANAREGEFMVAAVTDATFAGKKQKDGLVLIDFGATSCGQPLACGLSWEAVGRGSP